MCWERKPFEPLDVESGHVFHKQSQSLSLGSGITCYTCLVTVIMFMVRVSCMWMGIELPAFSGGEYRKVLCNARQKSQKTTTGSLAACVFLERCQRERWRYHWLRFPQHLVIFFHGTSRTPMANPSHRPISPPSSIQQAY